MSQAPALAGLARALVEPGNLVDPTAMAACEQLLTDGCTSPLLNPALAALLVAAVAVTFADGIWAAGLALAWLLLVAGVCFLVCVARMPRRPK